MSLELLCEELDFISHGPIRRSLTLGLDELLRDILVACGCSDYDEVDEPREATRRRVAMVEKLVPLLRTQHASGLIEEKWIAEWTLRADDHDDYLSSDRHRRTLFASDTSEETSRDFDSSSEEVEEEETASSSSSASAEEESSSGDCSREEGHEEEQKALKRAAGEPLALGDIELKKAKTDVQ